MIRNYELKQRLQKSNEKKKNELNKEENLKSHKKADNSYSNIINVGSKNDKNILNNSQIIFKNNNNISGEIEKEGDFRLGDVPQKILFAKKTKNGILFAVEWQKRENGVIPEVSFYDNSQLKTYSPQVLIDFYESHVFENNCF